MTHDRFKVLCALAHLSGITEETGLSPAEVVKACLDEKQKEKVTGKNVIAFPERDQRQLALFDVSEM